VQSAVQDELLSLLATAARAAGLARESWVRQGSGDGELAIIPPGESEPAVVDGFVGELAGLLYRRNRDRAPADRLLLRLAVDHGLAGPTSNGFSGRPVLAVSRLVNAAVVKQALVAAADASLAVIVSQQVYTDLIISGHTSLEPSLFRRVRVREKELDEHAWLRVPGVDVHRLVLTPDPAAPDGGPPDADLSPRAPGAEEDRGPAPRVTAEHSNVAMGDGNVVGTGNVVRR